MATSAELQQQLTTAQNALKAGTISQSEYNQFYAKQTALITTAKLAESRAAANQANNNSNANSNLTTSPQSTSSSGGGGVSPLPSDYWNTTRSDAGKVTGVTPGIGNNVGTWNVSSSSTTGKNLTNYLSGLRAQADYDLEHGNITRDEYEQQVSSIEERQGNIATAPEENPERSPTEILQDIINSTPGGSVYDVVNNKEERVYTPSPQFLKYQQELQKSSAGQKVQEQLKEKPPSSFNELDNFINRVDQNALYGNRPGNYTAGPDGFIINENSKSLWTGNPGGVNLVGTNNAPTNPPSYGMGGINALNPNLAFGYASSQEIRKINEQDAQYKQWVAEGKITQSEYNTWRASADTYTTELQARENQLKEAYADYRFWQSVERSANLGMMVTLPFVLPASVPAIAGGFVLGGSINVGVKAGMNYFTGKDVMAGVTPEDFIMGGVTGLWFSGAASAVGRGLASVGKSAVQAGLTGASSSTELAVAGLKGAGTGTWQIANSGLVKAGLVTWKVGTELASGTSWVATGLRAGVNTGIGSGLGYIGSHGSSTGALIGGLGGGLGTLAFEGIPKAARGAYNLLVNRGNVFTGNIPSDAQWIIPEGAKVTNSRGLTAPSGAGPSQGHITEFASALPPAYGPATRAIVPPAQVSTFANALAKPPGAPVSANAKVVSPLHVQNFAKNLPVVPGAESVRTSSTAPAAEMFNPDDYLVHKSSGKHPIGEGNQALLDKLTVDEAAYNRELTYMESGGKTDTLDYNPSTDPANNLPLPPKSQPTLAEITAQYPKDSTIGKPNQGLIERLADTPLPPTPLNWEVAKYTHQSLGDIRAQYPRSSSIARPNRDLLARMGMTAYGKAPRTVRTRRTLTDIAQDYPKGSVIGKPNQEVLYNMSEGVLPRPPEGQFDLAGIAANYPADSVIGKPDADLLARLGETAYGTAPSTKTKPPSLAEITQNYPAGSVIGRPNQSVIDRLGIDNAGYMRELAGQQEVIAKIRAQQEEQSIFESTKRNSRGGVGTATMARPQASASSGSAGLNEILRGEASRIETMDSYEQINRDFRASDRSQTRGQQLAAMRDGGTRFSNRQSLAGGATNTRGGVFGGATNSRSSIFSGTGIGTAAFIESDYTTATINPVETLTSTSTSSKSKTTPTSESSTMNVPFAVGIPLPNPTIPGTPPITDPDVTPIDVPDIDVPTKPQITPDIIPDTETREDIDQRITGDYYTNTPTGLQGVLPVALIPHPSGSTPRSVFFREGRPGARKRTHAINDPDQMMKQIFGGNRGRDVFSKKGRVNNSKTSPSAKKPKSAKNKPKKKPARSASGTKRKSKQTRVSSSQTIRRQRERIEDRVQRIRREAFNG